MIMRSTLVFDLDGTLSDPAEGIGRSLNYALMAHGFEPILKSAVSQYIGPPLDHTFESITGASGELIQKLVAKYRERYADIGFSENTLYPGIPEAIASLAANGCILGVCTSKRADFAERILEMFGLRAYFVFVDGGDIGIQKAQQLRSLLISKTIDLNATMIGDRSVDVMAAKSNKLRSVGVLWGHGTLAELTEAGADTILASVAEVPLLANA